MMFIACKGFEHSLMSHNATKLDLRLIDQTGIG